MPDTDRKKINKALQLIVVILTLCTFSVVQAEPNALHQRYNERHPLVFCSPWDFPPYCFQDNQSGPQGYSIDLLQEITQRLDIPIIVKLCSSKESYLAYKNKRSDICISLYNDTVHTTNGFYGQQVTNTMTCGYIEPKDHPSGIRSIMDLTKHHFYVNRYSIISYTLKLAKMGHNATITDNPKNTVLNMAAADSGIVVWHYFSLLYLKRIYHLDNMQVKPINMQMREYRFLSRDSLLIAAFDSVMGQMRAEESFVKLENKWLYPDRMTDDNDFNWELILGICFAIICIFFVFRQMYVQHLGKLKHENEMTHGNLKQLMRDANISIYVYDEDKDTFDVVVKGGYMTKATNKIRREVQHIKNGEKTKSVFIMNYESDERRYDKEFTVARYNETITNDRRYICIVRDVTNERLQQKMEKENALRFKAEFETSSLDIIYFDANGILTDINDHACHTFGYSDKQNILSKRLHINEIDTLNEYDLSSKDTRWVVAMAHHNGRDMYYDFITTPVWDKNEETIGFFTIGKDITEQVNGQKQHKATIRELEKATQKMYQYLQQANVSLMNNGISIITYHLDTHILDIGQAFDKEMKHYTQAQYLSLVDQEDLPDTFKLFENSDNKVDVPFRIQIKTKLKNEAGESVIWSINGFPIRNDKGEVDHYFGTKQDVTETVKMDKLIAQEAAKAKEAERLKDVFLQNISHDVRTPLNAIVGFAKMLVDQYKEEERSLFVEQIQLNTQKLLDLVNNILLLSRLDANMVETTMHQVDIAQELNELYQKVVNEKKLMLNQIKTKMAYEKLIVNIDNIHLISILNQLLNQLAIYIGKSMLKLRCFAANNELMISLETAGGGIPVTYLIDDDNNFMNDENGTKIVLSNCRRLIKLMGGRMEIQNDGKASSAIWLSVPCHIIESKLKHATQKQE